MEQLLDQVLDDLLLEKGLKKYLLLDYLTLIQEGLSRKRLVGEKTLEGLILKQVYDSLFPLSKIEIADGLKIIDLGSGAGIPGLIMAMYKPGCQFTLLEASHKKTEFINLVVKKLGIDNVRVVCERSEITAHRPMEREQYDLLVSKAVAEVAVLAELGLPFLKLGGRALLHKGPKGADEIVAARKALLLCGGKEGQKWQYILPTGEKRTIIEVNKIEITPDKYPRSPGKPAKKPLGL